MVPSRSVYGRVYGTGVWVGGYLGEVYRASTQPSGEQSHTSEAGPGRPSRGLEWVGMGLRALLGTVGGTAPGTHPPGPVGPHGPSLVPGPSECPPRANKGEINGHFL